MTQNIFKILILLPLWATACSTVTPPTLMERAEERDLVVSEFLALRGQGGTMAPVRIATQALFDVVLQEVGVADQHIALVALEGAQFENAALLNDRIIVIGRELEEKVRAHELRFVLAHELAHLVRPAANELEIDALALQTLGETEVPELFEGR